ncbi:MAG TPA: phosphotyrosine protein phosphatase [Micromonosporaceae bacterium]
MPPFSVLHVCMGNICRSPMAERLLVAALREAWGDKADNLLYSHSAGTGGWHEGEAINPPAARELRRRGVDDAGFVARKLLGEHVDSSDLVLTATADQWQYVVALRPDAAEHTFVLGEFGRLLTGVRAAGLPPAEPTPDAVYHRASAIVGIADRIRGGRPPRPEDDLDDPWGRNATFFVRIADQIAAGLRPFVTLLTG